MAEEIIER
ncbi:hypothetical protein RDI58_004099 [Solanum bulbocastanum]|uniref:Uncharacterized protein n=1 Tax=Solanum bulbocastanum TaxID=147425 RepID=A0AAN8TX91_SOLBU